MSYSLFFVNLIYTAYTFTYAKWENVSDLWKDIQKCLNSSYLKMYMHINDLNMLKITVKTARENWTLFCI